MAGVCILRYNASHSQVGPVLARLPKEIHSRKGALIAGLGLFDKEGIKEFEKMRSVPHASLPIHEKEGAVSQELFTCFAFLTSSSP